MKIQDSLIGMTATSEKKTFEASYESFTVSKGKPEKLAEIQPLPQTPTQTISEPDKDKFSLSDAGQRFIDGMSKKLEAMKISPLKPASTDYEDFRLSLLRMMIEKLTGKEFVLRSPSIELFSNSNPIDFSKLFSNIGSLSNSSESPELNIRYQSEHIYQESQKMTFSAQGIVTTSDGRSIDISIDLSMSREFAVRQSIEFEAGITKKLKDPLVINLDGSPIGLTQTKYSFDLDNNGTPNQISFVNPGSGFLVLDKNGDGSINNGSEMFGAVTGDAFKELARYDSDNNGWIDENDDIYDKLRIWMKDESGNDTLIGLGQAGVGAIYLGNIGSAYELKDSANNLNGAIRTSGLYLKESGLPGMMHQIDLAI